MLSTIDSQSTVFTSILYMSQMKIFSILVSNQLTVRVSTWWRSCCNIRMNFLVNFIVVSAVAFVTFCHIPSCTIAVIGHWLVLLKPTCCHQQFCFRGGILSSARIFFSDNQRKFNYFFFKDKESNIIIFFNFYIIKVCRAMQIFFFLTRCSIKKNFSKNWN